MSREDQTTLTQLEAELNDAVYELEEANECGDLEDRMDAGLKVDAIMAKIERRVAK